HPPPLGVVEERPLGTAVDVLDRAAPGNFLDQLDRFAFAQHFEVIGDLGGGETAFPRNLDRAQLALRDNAEDVHSQWVPEGGREARRDEAAHLPARPGLRSPPPRTLRLASGPRPALLRFHLIISDAFECPERFTLLSLLRFCPFICRVLRTVRLMLGTS